MSFNTTKEIMIALLDGKELINKLGVRINLDHNGALVGTCSVMPNIKNAKDWLEYKEPKWYDNIPKEGVLCKLWSAVTVVVYCIVIKYESNKFITTLGCSFENAVPVKPEECYVSNN
jgi:hypothetical protein